MTIASQYQDNHSLVDLKRLAYLLKSLNEQEIETIEILLDNEACPIMNRSIEECNQEKGVPIEQW
ncbi:MAG: hypothetical protein JXA44_11790 [Methanospirillaceae archaeon]|nr:hypothetical protein [Methanospirillaceae archaeon]